MATGTSSKLGTVGFHSDEPEEVTQYRSLSVLALISLIFGLASPLAFGMPLLIGIPLFGIGISILALHRIATSDGALTGSWMAVAGLFLCIAFAIAPFSREYVVRAIRVHEAQSFAHKWLDTLVAGHPEQAFRLTVDGNRPQAAPASPQPPMPGEQQPKTDYYQTFLGSPVIKALQAAGANAEITPGEVREYTPQTYRNIWVRQVFTVKPSPTAKGTDVLLTTQRSQFPGESMSRWLISRYEDPAAATTTPAAQ
jgi:hypothetical protein